MKQSNNSRTESYKHLYNCMYIYTYIHCIPDRQEYSLSIRCLFVWYHQVIQVLSGSIGGRVFWVTVVEGEYSMFVPLKRIEKFLLTIWVGFYLSTCLPFWCWQNLAVGSGSGSVCGFVMRSWASANPEYVTLSMLSHWKTRNMCCSMISDLHAISTAKRLPHMPKGR